MAYEKLNLEDGVVLNAEHMAHIEEGISKSVSCDVQTLTEDQKAQTRENIGAITEKVRRDTLFFDGNTNGRITVDDCYVKVSDLIPTIEDFANDAIVGTAYGVQTLYADDVEEESGAFSCGYVVVVREANAEFWDLVWPESGIYLSYNDGVSFLTINGYTGFEPITDAFVSGVDLESRGFVTLTELSRRNYATLSTVSSNYATKTALNQLRNSLDVSVTIDANDVASHTALDIYNLTSNGYNVYLDVSGSERLSLTGSTLTTAIFVDFSSALSGASVSIYAIDASGAVEIIGRNFSNS